MERKNVLVVDPDRHWAKELCRALDRSGLFFVAPPLNNGKAALAYIQMHQPNVIVMEMLLDEYDGLYLVGYIREHMKGYEPLVYILSDIQNKNFCRLITEYWDNIHLAKKPQDTRCVIENIDILTRGHSVPAPAFRSLLSPPLKQDDRMHEIDHQVEDFLLRLNPKYHTKQFMAAKTAMKFLLTENKSIPSMGTLYQKTAEQMGGTKCGAERNLRTFRKTAEENGSDYYHEKLAAYNSNNGDFYWNAFRILKMEISNEQIQGVAERQKRDLYYPSVT